MLSRFHWKKSVVAGAMTLSVFAASTSPIFAAENILQRAQRSFSSAVDGIVLSLPGKKSGKLVMKRMNESYKDLKSFDSSTTIDIDLLGNGQSVGKAQLNLAGPTIVGEVWNPQTYQQDMKVDGSVSFEGTTLSAAADLRMLDGVTYMRITQLPSIPGFNLDQVKNQWVKMDPAAQGVRANEMKFNAEQQQALQDAFMKMLESSTVSEAKPEKKDGENVFVMTVTISKPALVEYIKTVAEINQDILKNAATTPAEQDALALQSPEKMTQDVERALDSVGEVTSTIWVERKNYFPTYFELPLEVDLTKVAGDSLQQGAGTPEVDRLKMSIVSDTRKFNEDFSIDAPSDAQDADVFFQSIMGSALAPSAGMNSSVRQTTPTELRDLTPAQQRQLEELEMQYMMELDSLGY